MENQQNSGTYTYISLYPLSSYKLDVYSFYSVPLCKERKEGFLNVDNGL